MTPQELEAMRKLGQIQPSAPVADAYPESQQMYSQAESMPVQPASPEVPQANNPAMFVGEGQDLGEAFRESMNDVFEGRSRVITPVDQLRAPEQQSNVPLLDLANPSKRVDEDIEPPLQTPRPRAEGLMEELKSKPLPQATNGDVAARKDAVAAPQQKPATAQDRRFMVGGGNQIVGVENRTGKTAEGVRPGGVSLDRRQVAALTGEGPNPAEDLSKLKDTFDSIDSMRPLDWWQAVHKQASTNPDGTVAKKLRKLQVYDKEAYNSLYDAATQDWKMRESERSEKAKLDRDVLQEKARLDREAEKERSRIAEKKEDRDWQSKENDRKAERDKQNRIEEKRISREESEQAIQREKDKDTEAKLTEVEDKFLEYDRGPDGKITDPAVQQQYEQMRATVVRSQRNKNPKYPGWKLEREEQKDASLEARYGAKSAQHEKEFALRQRKDAISELISMRKGTDMAGKLPTEDEISEYMSLLNPGSADRNSKPSVDPTGAAGLVNSLARSFTGKDVVSENAVSVTTAKEAASLPPGTRFRTPDGRIKVRP